MTDAPLVSRPAAIVGPGRHVRFAVIADDGRRSMAWAVWTNRRTLDAYLDVRPLSGKWKISLHQSGSWQSGMTKEWAETMAPDLPSRHFDLWQRPEEFAPGTRRSVQVVIPDTDLRRWPAGVTDDKPLAVTVTAPGVGHAACIEFIFMPSSPPDVALVFAEPAVDIAALSFHDGSMLRLVSRQIPWMTVDVEWLLTQKTAMLSRIDPETLINARAPRGIITGKHDHGMRFAVDVTGDLDSSP
jgi:hypothetical protein